MDKNRVLDALSTLQAELSGNVELDETSRRSLESIAADIRRQLERGEPLEDSHGDSLPERLQGSILEFDAEHPQVTAAVNQVAAALANLGI